MKNLILLLLPLSISFDYSPQTKGLPNIPGCIKACTITGSKIIGCSKELPDDDFEDDNKEESKQIPKKDSKN
jgi:hypothetical protein